MIVNSNIVYLLVGILAVNIAMILYMNHKLSQVTSDIAILRKAIALLASGLHELRNSLAIAEKNTQSIHNILVAIEHIQSQLKELDVDR